MGVSYNEKCEGVLEIELDMFKGRHGHGSFRKLDGHVLQEDRWACLRQR